jgi:hypothetical protein
VIAPTSKNNEVAVKLFTDIPGSLNPQGQQKLHAETACSHTDY